MSDLFVLFSRRSVLPCHMHREVGCSFDEDCFVCKHESFCHAVQRMQRAICNVHSAMSNASL